MMWEELIHNPRLKGSLTSKALDVKTGPWTKSEHNIYPGNNKYLELWIRLRG